MNKLILIAAIGKNKELGKDNNLIWRIKGDMKFFKEHTINHHILMGKNTFLSLPKLLPDRTHLVLTSNGNDLLDEVIVLNSIDEVLTYLKEINDDVYVIGGASIYKQMIDLSSEMLLTEIDAECLEADVYFPDFKNEDWERTILEEHSENNPTYRHVLYRRR